MLSWPLVLLALAAEPPLPVRGIYGGVPEALLEGGRTLADVGVNAVWYHSGSLNHELIARWKAQGARVFAEFNTLHAAEYLKEHPDAAPVGADGLPCPPPDGWQGVSPTHPGYRRWRMDEFRRILTEFDVDGIWLDYHHAHANWERAEPLLPEVGFDPRSLAQFERDTGIDLPEAPVPELARRLLGELREPWVAWNCSVLTDWVREFAAIRDAVRPGALLGTFHCPWSDTDLGGALRHKLFIDLRGQMPYLDVFSPMPYHARFGHVDDVDWIRRQVAWLGEHLGLTGAADERVRLWPIVQLADWETPVPPEQVSAVLAAGAARPASGVLVFHGSGLQARPEKLPALVEFYLQNGDNNLITITGPGPATMAPTPSTGQRQRP